MSLEGKVAFITGASRGIGRGIARLLAEQGMKVAVNGRSDGAQRVANELTATGHTARAFIGDISDKAQVEAMIQQTEDELGPLWLLVNNAGVINFAPTVDMPEADWDKTFDVNIKGVFLCSQAALRYMQPRKAGRIVNISSIASEIVRTERIAYCASKAAVNHFTRCLAVEVAPLGITVNCICPGMTHTDMLEEAMTSGGSKPENLLATIPMGKFAVSEDHAHLVAYFASEEAGHITGQVIRVDGGQSQFMPYAVG